ncbi:uncharacterized protein N7482_008475 [Penicillium canariense]|uniref:Uncharacterized protein n=1 Tax=Penicillium canariense TaxID=189055 RepID=A0A9W9LJ14_9EURO|nr:uncharacterized protein N7482_008475 [Penicillium canariense]KAJ5157375.1 hypothetical protein N7482_008475 [Penicillium canariense]
MQSLDQSAMGGQSSPVFSLCSAIFGWDDPSLGTAEDRPTLSPRRVMKLLIGRVLYAEGSALPPVLGRWSGPNDGLVYGFSFGGYIDKWWLGFRSTREGYWEDLTSTDPTGLEPRKKREQGSGWLQHAAAQADFNGFQRVARFQWFPLAIAAQRYQDISEKPSLGPR